MLTARFVTVSPGGGESCNWLPMMLAGGVDMVPDVGGTYGLGAVGLLPLPPHATMDKTAVTTRVDREVISNWLWPLLSWNGFV
jgi:hypothetical protein